VSLFTNARLSSTYTTCQGHQPYQEQSVLCPSRGRGALDSAGLFAKAQLSLNLLKNLQHASVRAGITTTWLVAVFFDSGGVSTAKMTGQRTAKKAQAVVILQKRTCAYKSVEPMSLTWPADARSKRVGWPAGTNQGVWGCSRRPH
jgi:hypothetical protein